MQLQLITPEKILFSGDITQVNLPGEAGDFGVLPGHMPLIAALQAGIAEIETTAGKERYTIGGGVAEITPDKCVVLATDAEAA